MRIIHIIKQFYPYMGGGETAIYDLCKAIEKNDKIKENIIITSRLPNTNKEQKLFTKTTIRRIGKPIDYDKDRRFKLFIKTAIRDLSLYNELKKYVNNQTIIHVHGPIPLPLIFRPFKGLFSKNKHFRPWENFGRPIIMHYHARDNVPLSNSKWLAERDYKHSNMIIIVDKDIESYFSKKNKIVYIPNGVNLEKFKPSNAKRKYITFIGRIYSIKGWRIFAQAVKGMKNTLIIGHGPEQGEAKKIFDGKIILGVKNEDMKNYYAESKIVVCPYQNKGISRVLLEAMASGCIVIKSNLDPTPIINGKNGFTFQYDDPEDLRKVIKKVLAIKETKLKQIRNKARETIIKNYSSKNMTGKIFEIYEEFA